LVDFLIDIDPIGGYFELELPTSHSLYHDTAYRYQSARAAFRAILIHRRPSKVWVPKYICNSMLTPLVEEGIDYGWYDLDSNFNIRENVLIQENEVLLYVNYFGICEQHVQDILTRYSPAQLIIDYSQAHPKILGAIYSPRKFFGVPDGGFLITDKQLTLPTDDDEGSINRMSHLIKRLSGSPESGYLDYQIAERSLDQCIPRKMSKLTVRLLGAINYDEVKVKRSENFTFLHRHLEPINTFEMGEYDTKYPMFYPFITKNTDLREKLLGERIFLPTYWVDAVERVGEKWADQKINRLLPLPIDHRYGESEMMHVVKLILQYSYGY